MAENRASPDKVLAELLHRPPISRADLARLTGLSRASMTSIVDEFQALSVIEDNIPTVSFNGRKSTGVALRLDEFYVAVARINREEITFLLYNGGGEAIRSDIVRFERHIRIEKLVPLLIDGIKEMVDARPPQFVLGISISILGWLLETDGRVIAHVDGFPELGRRDIREEVRAHFPDIPVFLEHDAKTSALAEYRDYVTQTQRKPACVLNIVGGIGLGGGIVINGEVFHGQGGAAGEVGHLGINFNSPRVRDMEGEEYNGLFEDYASPRALCESVASRLLEFPDSVLTESSTPEDVHAAFEAGDPLATWAMNRMSQLTAYGLAGLVFVLNPDLIVLGDRFPVSAAFVERLNAHLARHLPPPLMRGLEVKVSRLGNEGVLFGSYLLVVQHYVRNNQLYGKIRQARMKVA